MIGGSKNTIDAVPSLQIMPMASVFTVILVLLLKSYTGGLATIMPSSETHLPELEQSDEVSDSPKIEISARGIFLNDKLISPLENFNFTAQGATDALTSALESERNAVPNPKPSLLILADKRVPYSTVKRVITSASDSGFATLKLVVIKKQ
ncbi:MAG: biopolymer transporter ExbD [Deltaproteobacteria bacterium]|nr:biopolymer transporter ExbD [Deltaproteobacteria bacterium]